MGGFNFPKLNWVGTDTVNLDFIECTTLWILIKALPPIRALPRKNAYIFIRALPLIRALPGKSQSLTVKIFYRQF